MPCTRPMKAQRLADGSVKMVSSHNKGDGPGRDGWFRIPCGQCIACRLKKTREWAVRCIHEAQMHKQNCFLTLTYNGEHIPTDLSVDVSHWQNFAKKVRNKLGPFRFLHCGEYGEENLRPHYHACIFGQDFSGDRIPWKEQDTSNALYVSPLLNELWPFGFSTVGSLTFDSAAYVAAYTIKKVNGAQSQKEYSRLSTTTGELWTVKPPYATMSRNPGLGNAFYNQYKGDIYPDDFVIVKGKKFEVPRYYDGLLKLASPQEFEEVRRRRTKRAIELASDNTPERLDVKESVHEQNYAIYSGRNNNVDIGNDLAHYVDELRNPNSGLNNSVT